MPTCGLNTNPWRVPAKDFRKLVNMRKVYARATAGFFLGAIVSGIATVLFQFLMFRPSSNGFMWLISAASVFGVCMVGFITSAFLTFCTISGISNSMNFDLSLARPVGYCILSGAKTDFRLPNGDSVCPEYVEEMKNSGWLSENLEFTDRYFEANPHLLRVVGEDGHVLAFPKKKFAEESEFTDRNDHNPLVPERCPNCQGAGTRCVESSSPTTVTVSCEECLHCRGTGKSGKTVRLFDNDNPEMELNIYSDVWIKCPNCEQSFALKDESIWTGRRHKKCGQKIKPI